MEKDGTEIEKARKAKEKRRKAKDIVRDVSVSIDPLTKLNKDLSDAAKLMTAEEARYLVDLYYQIQGIRVGTGNQITSIQPTEPTAILAWSFGSMNTIENAIRTALDKYTDGNHMGKWAKSVIGIGPVISAGLLAHIDISKVKTVGGIWRFGGVDPTSVWNKGEKRPWNAALKTLIWKCSESFVKVSGNEKSFYGKLYVERKQFEVQRNNDGLNAEAAKKSLEEKKFSKSTDAYKAYAAGKLPDARVHLRATRWTVKIFLYFWFAEAYYHLHKKEPPMPYVIDQLKHTKLIWPDNMSFVPKDFPVQVKAVNQD